MASYICLFALCFLVAVMEGHIIKTGRTEIPSQGLTIEILIKPYKPHHRRNDDVIAKRIKDIFKNMGDEGKVKTTPANVKDGKQKPGLPTVESRLGITAGICAEGFVRRRGFCFPDYD